MIAILQKYGTALANGITVTLQLAAIAWVVGLFLGGAVGYISRNSNIGSRVIHSLSFVLASIPVLAILFWVHYPLQYNLRASIDPFFTTASVLAIINVSLVASIVRRSAKLVPRQYLDSARLYGVSKFSTFWRIEMPLLLRASVSELLTLQVVILHMTLFGSLISVNELFRVAQRINALEYKPVELYTIVGGFYLLISAPLNLVAAEARRRYQRDFSER